MSTNAKETILAAAEGVPLAVPTRAVVVRASGAQGAAAPVPTPGVGHAGAGAAVLGA